MSVNPVAALILKVNDLETQIASLGGTQSKSVNGVISSSQDAITVELLNDTGQTQGVFGSDGLNLELHYSGLLAADGKSFDSFSARLLLTVELEGTDGAEPFQSGFIWSDFMEMDAQFGVDASGLTGEKQMAWTSALYQVTLGKAEQLYGSVAWMGYENINRTPDRYGAAGSTAIPILAAVYDSDGVMSPTQMNIMLGNGLTVYSWKNIYTSFSVTSQWQAQWQLSGLSPAEPAAAPVPSGSGLTAALRSLPIVKHFLRGRSRGS